VSSLLNILYCHPVPTGKYACVYHHITIAAYYKFTKYYDNIQQHITYHTIQVITKWQHIYCYDTTFFISLPN